MKKMQLEYEIKYGKKNLGCSVTYNLEIYEIPSTETYPYPTRIIDTCGFCDARGIDYDSKIIEDIKNLFVNSKIDNLNAICLIFKANDTRAHTRAEYIINPLNSHIRAHTQRKHDNVSGGLDYLKGLINSYHYLVMIF